MMNSSRLKLVIALMALAGVIIIGMAVYVFSNFSSLGSSQGMILAGIGVVALFIVMSVVAVLLKSLISESKATNDKK